MSRFARYAGFTLAFNLLVILWGAYVRASGSGAGCGRHWPLCNGEVVPSTGTIHTLIELLHRMSSGLSLLLVTGLVVAAYRSFPRRHPVRVAATMAGVFICTEAAVGAGLVLFQYVAENESVARAWWMALHLVNTFLLLASLTLTWRWSTMREPPRLRLRGQGAAPWIVATGVILTCLGTSGAITALGDTLYLSQPEVNGVRQGLSPAGEFLVDLRVYHPWIAVGVGVYVAVAAYVLYRLRPDAESHRWLTTMGLLFLVQLGIGVMNVGLKAPIPIQLVHLAMADSVWMSFVLLGSAALSAPATAEQPAPATDVATAPAGP